MGCWIALTAPDADQLEETSRVPLLDNMMQGNAEHRFASVTNTRPFEFPRDHGAHLDFQTEWWYFTGNLVSEDGDRYGYQFTVFRRAFTRDKPKLDSDWAGTQVFLAQAGVTSVRAGEYLVDEIYSRGVLDLAGIRADPFSVWVENWVAEGSAGSCEGCLNLSISVSSDEFSFDLALRSVKPVVLHGDGGLSQKSDRRGEASYYYSLTRLQTTGELTVQGQSKQVSGDSWMDHEWFSSALGEEQTGWDWFSLQLDDQRELMLFQVRQHDPSLAPFKYGLFIDQYGNTQLLAPNQIILEKLRTWRSEMSQSEYPVHWKVEIPPLEMLLDIEAAMDAQERTDSFRYWEGVIDVNGQEGATPLTGHGYLEMTGY